MKLNLFRPSLETIMSHPFFTHDPLKIPISLPSCCTHVAPDWQEDRSGRLVPVLAEGDEAQYRSKVESSSNRNGDGRDYRQTHVERTERHPYPTQKVASLKDDRINQLSSKTNKFEIYDDTPERRSHRRRSTTPLPQNELRDSKPETFDFDSKQNDELSDKIQKCTLDDRQTEEKGTDCLQSNKQANTYDAELNALEVMYERLKDTNARVEASGGPSNFTPICQSDVPGAQTWVTRYVDYTSKYGLGFLFNDGR